MKNIESGGTGKLLRHGIKDLTGQRFGRLTAIALDYLPGERVRWRCRCDCGKETRTLSSSLLYGKTKSCGCLAAEGSAQRARARAKHGMSDSSEHGVWSGMINRCHNPSEPGFHRYGARGITVCEEWRASFKAFFDHIGPRPSKAHSVERIKNDVGYQPGNVRWATPVEQANNRRNNLTVTFQGETLTAAQLARRYGFSLSTMARRIRAGRVGGELVLPLDRHWRRR